MRHVLFIAPLSTFVSCHFHSDMHQTSDPLTTARSCWSQMMFALFVPTSAFSHAVLWVSKHKPVSSRSDIYNIIITDALLVKVRNLPQEDCVESFRRWSSIQNVRDKSNHGICNPNSVTAVLLWSTCCSLDHLHHTLVYSTDISGYDERLKEEETDAWHLNSIKYPLILRCWSMLIQLNLRVEHSGPCNLQKRNKMV